MITAVILAGGSGTRMGLDIPKQFVNVYCKFQRDKAMCTEK